MLSFTFASEAGAQPLGVDSDTTTVDTSDALNPDEFVPCAADPNAGVPANNRAGEAYGPGISEELTADLRDAVNTGLSEEGNPGLSDDAVSLRYLDDGRIIALDADDVEVQQLSAADRDEVSPQAVIPQEAKEIIGACLGFSWESGPLAEQIFREVTSVDKAIKFIIRRVGLGAAIGCVGGIIWHYI